MDNQQVALVKSKCNAQRSVPVGFKAEDKTSMFTPRELLDMPFILRDSRQNWAIVSIIGPGYSKNVRISEFAMQICRVCDTKDQADRLCEEAMKSGYDKFDLFVLDISNGFFPLCPPENNSEYETVRYTNQPFLEKIMGNHRNQVAQDFVRVEERSKMKPKPFVPTPTPILNDDEYPSLPTSEVNASESAPPPAAKEETQADEQSKSPRKKRKLEPETECDSTTCEPTECEGECASSLPETDEDQILNNASKRARLGEEYQ